MFHLKTIALIDPFWSGHHSTYLILFSKALLSLGHKVIAFSQNPQDIKDGVFANNSDVDERFKSFKIQEVKEDPSHTSILNSSFAVFRRWKIASLAIKNYTLSMGVIPDMVFFPWLDSYLDPYLNFYIVDRVFKYNWAGLYFHPRHLRSEQSFPILTTLGLINPDRILGSKRCKAVAVLDENISLKLQKELRGKTVVTFPDIADDSKPDVNYDILNLIKKKARHRKIIALVGSLAKRKGVITLLEVAKKSVNKDWFFLFAGRLAEQTFTNDELVIIKNYVKQEPDNCFFFLEFIPDESKLNALIEMSDILFAVYEDFLHSSNMITKAAILKKPIIVSKGSCMEERIKEFNMGVSINENSVSQCIDAIHEISTKGDHALSVPDFEGCMRAHSPERLISAFKELLDVYEINQKVINDI